MCKDPGMGVSINTTKEKNKNKIHNKQPVTLWRWWWGWEQWGSGEEYTRGAETDRWGMTQQGCVGYGKK